jgi:DNA repair exonuclease SbcCD nuclease subunit
MNDVELMLIAGDLFDDSFATRETAAHIRREFASCPNTRFVISPGNHDPYNAASFYAQSALPENVYIFNQKELSYIEFDDINTTVYGYAFTSGEYTENPLRGFSVPDDGRIHLFCAHCDLDVPSSSYCPITTADILNAKFDYAALGHIHKAQTFDNGRARYCGSPLPVSFDEVKSGYEHGFSIVEIEAHGSTPSIRTCDVTCMHPLVNIPSEGFALWEDAMKELKKFPADIDAYLRLNILLKGNEMLPYDKDAQIIKALGGKIARLATINPAREIIESADNEEERVSLTMQELQAMDPKAILKAYANAIGRPFDEEFDEMFDIVFKNVMDADHEN